MVEGSLKLRDLFLGLALCKLRTVHSMYIFRYKTSKANFLLAPSNFRWTLPPGFHARVVCTRSQLYPSSATSKLDLYIPFPVYHLGMAFHFSHHTLLPSLLPSMLPSMLPSDSMVWCCLAAAFPVMQHLGRFWNSAVRGHLRSLGLFPSSRPTNTRDIHRHKANHNLSNCTWAEINLLGTHSDSQSWRSL